MVIAAAKCTKAKQSQNVKTHILLQTINFRDIANQLTTTLVMLHVPREAAER